MATTTKQFYSTGKTGLLESLTTTQKGTLVGAINELDSEHGNLSSLTTTQKGTLVGAINELNSNISNIDALGLYIDSNGYVCQRLKNE